MLSTMQIQNASKREVLTGGGHYFSYWLLDVVTFFLAFTLALLLRFDGQAYEYNHRFVSFFPLVVVGYASFTYVFGLHRRIWQSAGLADMLSLAQAIVLTTLCALTADILFVGDYPLPISVIVSGGVFSLLGISSARIYHNWKGHLGRSSKAVTRVLVVGCGEAGQMLARELLYNRAWNYLPVGFVDDNPHNLGLVVHGLRVHGSRRDIPALVQSLQVDLIAIATPAASSADVQRIVAQVGSAAVGVKLMPALPEMMAGNPGLTARRGVTVADLLGREEVEIDYAACREYISGRVVLVTGAAGSIGSELCRQLITLAPAQLLILDTNESGLYDLNFELSYIAPNVPVKLCLTDIANRRKLEQVFEQQQPQVIFHAAAYKHVPMMEDNADQAVLANVQGTLNLARLANDYQCDRFVSISTDKAVRPANVMGATKRVAELITMNMADNGHTRFCAVRFGNVLGSRGSVVPLFQRQIEQGGPVTVTSPEVRRFFMSIPEAVSLVIQGGAYGDSNSVYMLDMGQPVRISDLAERMIRLQGYRPGIDIKITYTGLRPGEKLDEELTTPDESVQPSGHRHIFQVITPALQDTHAFFRDAEWLCDMANISSPTITRHLLWSFIGRYDPSHNQALVEALASLSIGYAPQYAASSKPLAA